MQSPHCPEAGFSLVEVLAALAIAALTVVMVLDVFSGTARLGHRLEMETEARMLARGLMAGNADTAGEAGPFSWTLARSQTGVRRLEIDWPDAPGLVLSRLDSLTAIVESTP